MHVIEQSELFLLLFIHSGLAGFQSHWPSTSYPLFWYKLLNCTECFKYYYFLDMNI